jgi:WD40 repeat protein/mono/diheme cytochrome c family protein
MRHCTTAICVVTSLLGSALSAQAVAPPPRIDPALTRQAQAVLRTYCHRCHGQDGSIEGGLNYVLDPAKLIARRKIVPGAPERSPLLTRIHKGKMPPPDEKPRPTLEEIRILDNWVRSGAPGIAPAHEPRQVSEATVLAWILADLEKTDRRARRFVRYFSLAPLANAGHGPDELQTYRKALAKLLNSLSWHPRITLPTPIDAEGLVLRIDLRDFLLDANLWNRVLADYPYGIFHDTGIARAVLSATATRVPVVRADWFIATASRAPLYYDLLQIPVNLSELERQLRVDSTADIQQERVARAGFNGSGVSRNNRILERHDAMNGAYWRTYDFLEVPQNLLERNILTPDPRNIFAFPLGPNLGDTGFKHAGGEAIFNLPNGLQAYILVNAVNQRVNKAPTEIVSDPKRPDRAVEAGLSCMHCHSVGIIPKDDQVRDHISKNKKAFTRSDVEVIGALYPPAAKMRRLMEEDARRFQQALEKTGNRHTANEVTLAVTLRYEADVDLGTLSAEVGVRPTELVSHLTATENLAKNLGALRSPGATVSRQVVTQAFGDLVRELRLGGVFQPGTTGESLPDATGEADPLEAQSSPANAAAFSPDGKRAAFASADRSVRLYDVETARDLRRLVGHTASVWCVAFSSDGTRLLSGGKDGTVRLWDVETGREIHKLEGHTDLVSAVAFAPNGRRALSAGYDQTVILWDLERGARVPVEMENIGKYVHSITFSSDGARALIAAGPTLSVVEVETGKVSARLVGHADWVRSASFTTDGKGAISAADDGTARLWNLSTGTARVFQGHVGPVTCAILSADGKRLVTGGNDATVRLWDATTGAELRVFRKHAEPVVAVTFAAGNEKTLSVSRDAVVLPWRIAPTGEKPPSVTFPSAEPVSEGTLRSLAVIPVNGTVGALHVAPDRTLYFFNRTDGVLGRLDLTTRRITHRLTLPERTDVVAMSRDGRTLVAINPETEGKTRFQVIDPRKLTVARSFVVAGSAYDLQVRDDGVAFFTGAGAEWTDVTAVDTTQGKLIGAWSGVWTRSLLRLTPDGRRLYLSSQGVTPGTLDAMPLPTRLSADRPSTYRAPGYQTQSLGGDFVLTPDGRFLLNRTGAGLRLSSERDADMQPLTRLEPFLAAAVDVAGGRLYLLEKDGTLRRYAYPEFRPLGRLRMPFAAYALAVDENAGVLYAAGIDPKSVADAPRARGYGEIQVFSLKGLR